MSAATATVRWLAGIALGCAAHACVAGDDARALLDRMAEAARTLNYDGTFAYRKGEEVESMRIIHRVEPDGTERERLLSLNGIPREVIRDDGVVRCILPDDGVVMKAKAGSGALPAPAMALARAGGSDYYRLSVASAGRIAGRPTRSVTIEPTDGYRHGYKLWLDTASSLLLRSVVRGPRDEVLEEIVYTSISTPETIPDELLEPETPTGGFVIKDLDAERAEKGAGMPVAVWEVTDPPPGFVPAQDEGAAATGQGGSMAHLVLSDGIASASVFVEPLVPGSEPLEGVSRMGPVSAFGRVVDDHQVTVVGEVPPAAVERIGLSVRRR